jgi:murein DD-endopeptidase MepM/ murein hydrolase activator NlpD
VAGLLLLLPAPAGAYATFPHGSAVPASSPAAAPPASPPSAAAAAVGRPTVDAVTCRTGCLGLAQATAGSVVRVAGDGAASAASVVFLGRRGAGDDVTAPARPAGPGAAEATLPAGAYSGPVRLVTTDGRRSEQSDRAIVAGGSRGGGELDARVETRRAFVDGTRRAVLDVFVGAAGPADVAVDLVRPSDGGVLAHWVLPAVAAGTVQSVEWDGTAGGAAQREGRYVFRVSARPSAAQAAATGVTGLGAAAAVTAPSAPPRASSFVLLRNRFPISGAHRYGTGGGRFGAGRSGHGHQGQDVFAACGTPLVAAHGGTVTFEGFQGSAGNYVVIRTDAGPDHVYMHLRDPAHVKEGATVATGAPIGFVGDTGDAFGCHLHFELWRAPGWQSASPVDPLGTLRGWDAAG